MRFFGHGRKEDRHRGDGGRREELVQRLYSVQVISRTLSLRRGKLDMVLAPRAVDPNRSHSPRDGQARPAAHPRCPNLSPRYGESAVPVGCRTRRPSALRIGGERCAQNATRHLDQKREASGRGCAAARFKAGLRRLTKTPGSPLRAHQAW
jgi:hypothetical protein